VLRTLRKAVRLHSARRTDSFTSDSKAAGTGVGQSRGGMPLKPSNLQPQQQLQKSAAPTLAHGPPSAPLSQPLPNSQCSASQPELPLSQQQQGCSQVYGGDSTIPGFDMPLKAMYAQPQQQFLKAQGGHAFDYGGSSMSTQTPHASSLDISSSQASQHMSQNQLGASQQLWPPPSQAVASQSVLALQPQATVEVAALQQSAPAAGQPAPSGMTACLAPPALAPCQAPIGQAVVPAPAAHFVAAANPQGNASKPHLPDVASAAAAFAAALAGMSNGASVRPGGTDRCGNKELLSAKQKDDELDRRQRSRRRERSPSRQPSPPKRRRIRQKAPPTPPRTTDTLSPSSVTPVSHTSSTYREAELAGGSKTLHNLRGCDPISADGRSVAALLATLESSASQVLLQARQEVQRFLEDGEHAVGRYRQAVSMLKDAMAQYRRESIANEKLVEEISLAIQDLMAVVKEASSRASTSAAPCPPQLALANPRNPRMLAETPAAGGGTKTNSMHVLRRPRRLIDGIAADSRP